MNSLLQRRDVIAATVASASMVLCPPARAYGCYNTARKMQAPRYQKDEFVWQWLVLLIDASSSMTRPFERMSFYEMQIEATARALMEPCVVGRLIGPPTGRTAIGVILWSASMQQEIAIHWQILRAVEDIAVVATRLRRAANSLDSYTGTAAAIRFATKQLTAAHIPRECRRIINMTANGRDNHGGDPPAAAREAEQAGVTINAIVMRGYDGTVDDMYEYYRREVVTRDGLVFKVESEDQALESLAVANASKFCAEIALAPFAACLPT